MGTIKPICEFKAYLEPFEVVGKNKNDPVVEACFLRKYGGLLLASVDNGGEVLKIYDKSLCFHRSRKASERGWAVYGLMPEEKDINEDTTQLFINEDLIEQIVVCDNNFVCMVDSDNNAIDAIDIRVSEYTADQDWSFVDHGKMQFLNGEKQSPVVTRV